MSNAKLAKTFLFVLSTMTLSSAAFSQDVPYIAGGAVQTVGSCTPYSGCTPSANTPGSNIPYSTSDINVEATVDNVAVPACTEENVAFLIDNSLEVTTKDGATLLARNPDRYTSGFEFRTRRTLELLVENCAEGINLVTIAFVKEDADSITFRSESKDYTISREELTKSNVLTQGLKRGRYYPNYLLNL